MTDIDFDELDKAVNSLMGTVATETLDDGEEPKTLSISTTLKPDEKPEYEKVGQVAKEIGEETLLTDDEKALEGIELDADTEDPSVTDEKSTDNDDDKKAEDVVEKIAPVAPVKRPQSGRFMDVVHPSSDMRSATAVVESGRSTIKDTTTLPEPDQDNDHESDFDDDYSESSATENTQDSTEATSLTPFLPNTKVEKRPLGNGAAIGVGAVSSPFVEDEQKEDELTATDSEEPTESAEQNEDESSDDYHTVVAINSEPSDEEPDKVNDTQVALDAEAFSTGTSAEDEVLLSVESAELSETAPEVSPTIRAVESGDTEKVSSTSTGKNSDSKNTETTKDGAIYDVNEYHQPLSRPVKHKSGWGIVGIIALIIIVFAIIGVAAYFILGTGF